MSELKGRIEDWYLTSVPEGVLVCGDMHNDREKRWEDGHPIHTSLVLSIDFAAMRVTTLNSVYELGVSALPPH